MLRNTGGWGETMDMWRELAHAGARWRLDEISFFDRDDAKTYKKIKQNRKIKK